MATRGACDQYSLVPTRNPARGDACGGIGKLGGKSFPLAGPQTVPCFLLLHHCRHPQNTSTHTLLWLVIAANFIKFEVLGTKSSYFLLPSLARLALPGAKWEAVLGLQTWEGAVSESQGL